MSKDSQEKVVFKNYEHYKEELDKLIKIFKDPPKMNFGKKLICCLSIIGVFYRPLILDLTYISLIEFAEKKRKDKGIIILGSKRYWFDWLKFTKEEEENYIKQLKEKYLDKDLFVKEYNGKNILLLYNHFGKDIVDIILNKI